MPATPSGPNKGPEEPIDDRPQREDEFLSKFLQDSSPENKDKKEKGVVSGSDDEQKKNPEDEA